ncbi:conserved hypothetical protein [Treponema primitia ZAS-2]|uniref:Antitoxin SocA-like Panacea domain-containing protein n=1 Tax=Treponema primitia (strain ATCC BAA-887 / DSM 12427 / ZAS-2) TaxID=545694 RepID=F5YJI1_TREPZ|nr:Panacea domain-containing protein [Treponema primitia]AEF85862.1 conserved hypothetical protein [Treponema primitia ZAS-2]
MNIERLVQATGYLLKKYDNRRLNYTKLIKELYLADRASIHETNSSITGDTYVSMKNGPVLRKLYELIKGKSWGAKNQEYWDSRFSTDGNELLANFDQYPEGKLSRAEKEILDKIDGQFHQSRYGELIEYAHAHCPEWHNPGDTSEPISLEDILSALGRTPEQIEWILEENKVFEEEDSIFASLVTEK